MHEVSIMPMSSTPDDHTHAGIGHFDSSVRLEWVHGRSLHELSIMPVSSVVDDHTHVAVGHFDTSVRLGSVHGREVLEEVTTSVKCIGE